MMRTSRLWAIVLAIAPLPAQVVQLKSGDILVGKVDATEDGLTVQRFDNGGVLELAWEQLSTESAGRIKALFSLAVDEEGEVLVTADVVRYEVGGGGIEEIAGRILAEDANTITVRRRGLDTPVPRASIKQRSTLEVPALDVYTKDEFYNERLAQQALEDDADRHILFADLLVRVRDWDHAAAHLERAKELGGGRQPNVLEGKLKRLALFKSAADESDLLDRIRATLARKQFADGLKLLAEFDKRFPKGKLRGEFMATKQRFDKIRASSLTDQLVSLWYRQTMTLAQKKATDGAVTWAAAKEYAESQMGRDIRAAVATKLSIAAEEVDDLWTKRFDHGRRSTETFSYGVGSWTLGGDAVLKDTEQSKVEKAEKPSTQDREMEKQIKKIQDAIDRARRAASQSQQGKQPTEETPEDWWKSVGYEARMVWLRAYYAEFSGDLKVSSAHINACVGCGAEGSLTITGQTGKTEKLQCPTCHGTRFVRWLRAH